MGYDEKSRLLSSYCPKERYRVTFQELRIRTNGPRRQKVGDRGRETSGGREDCIQGHTPTSLCVRHVSSSTQHVGILYRVRKSFKLFDLIHKSKDLSLRKVSFLLDRHRRSTNVYQNERTQTNRTSTVSLCRQMSQTFSLIRPLQLQ